jgi:hypothetical protein
MGMNDEQRPKQKQPARSERKLKCHECGKRKPEDDTVLIQARVGGDYRRSTRWGTIRVCRDCTQAHVDYVNAEQAKQRNTPLNDRIYWQQAANFFGIVVSGLKLNQMTDRRAP